MSTSLSAAHPRGRTFHLYPNLPIELRLDIIDRFVAIHKATSQPTVSNRYDGSRRQQYGLARFATINQEWQGKIETLLQRSPSADV